MQTNIGITGTGIVDTKTFKALLTMNAYVLLTGGSEQVRLFQQWLNSTYGNKEAYYYYPCDGLYSRDCQEAIIYGIQYECGLDSVANGWFGPTTQANLKEKGIVQLGDFDYEHNFVHLFYGAFICNNKNSVLEYVGVFDMGLKIEVLEFQNFTALEENGMGDFQTWAELLVSTGDASRKTKALDCSIEKVNSERARIFKNMGIETIGRYLTNEGPSGDDFDKKLEQYEIDAIFREGMSIFPIFQTYHNMLNHFTYENGKSDAKKAFQIAKFGFGIPRGTVIYFPVDLDAYESQVKEEIANYFTGVKDYVGISNFYKIGIYGARNTCTIISELGLAEYSFVSGMSIGFSGNLGYPLPNNWSFNQIYEDAMLGIDNDVKSGRDNGFNTVDLERKDHWNIIGYQYTCKTGDFKKDGYLGYNKPNGDQVIEFNKNDDVYYMTNVAVNYTTQYPEWYLLCDSELNMFFIPAKDADSDIPGNIYPYGEYFEEPIKAINGMWTLGGTSPIVKLDEEIIANVTLYSSWDGVNPAYDGSIGGSQRIKKPVLNANSVYYGVDLGIVDINTEGGIDNLRQYALIIDDYNLIKIVRWKV